ncbi:uncharacterized protein N7443_005926 [Penicillium atrosanguineum]|uniref:uncharacterized protein n=1 Tax=Penicillium atrosanguineum TaxID=1132637 RepID=UPI002386EF38|nr:uncharacterized protein N7443_005926 [Penicillium atrosanguineum]KAJ5300924.1 hypothetical protein N7443_005926 [Penicillium atrosanguineum]
MDLRTIMNNDGGSKPAPPTQTSSSPIDPTQQQRAQQNYSDFATRPPQPPLQHPHGSPERSSPYAPPQSPYQQFKGAPAPPPLNTGAQSQRSQSPPQVMTPYGPGARDQYSASAYNSHPQHPAGPLASPYTPQPLSAGLHHPEQGSYFAQQRSHSLQSVMTNPQAPGETFRPRDSPPTATQPPPHHFSPPSHRPAPETPLGPPAAFSSRKSPSVRPLSSGRDSPRNPLSSPRPMQDTPMRDSTNTQSPSLSRNFSPSSRPSESTPQPHSAGLKQEHMGTASPEASRQNSIAGTSETAGAPMRSSEDGRWNESPTASFPSGPGAETRVSPIAMANAQMNSFSGPRSGSHPLKSVKMEVDHDPMPRFENQPSIDNPLPKAKRRRYNEPPIYAQRSVRTKGKCPVIPNPQSPVPKHLRQSSQEPWAARRRSSTNASAVTTATSHAVRTPGSVPPSANGPPPQAAPAPAPMPAPALAPQASTRPVGSLGPWEPSITGLIPFEEITKSLCDFLFKHVVMRNDVAVGGAGSAATGQGTIIEVEAKLGHVIDQDRRERLRLPVLTESVINRDSGFRTAFESSMTVEQHRAMNNFLNETVRHSMPAADPKRIPLTYAHKKERDTFYEVDPNDLPPVIRQNLNPRHKPKVRVTTDQRTGEVIAKIIKCRVADIDVYSPRTTVDWRVSVNLEMEYEGDHTQLPMVDASKGGRGERNKDRMSYRHLAYQIDLTQVARAELATKNEFEHELEIEISAAEIRRQGTLAMAGDPSNQYEELVKGFVDNIRVLARAVPP